MAAEPKAVTASRRPKSIPANAGRYESTAMSMPASIAASSATAFTRHQNQRRMRTAPGPVPIAIMKRKTVPMSWAKKAAVAARATMATELIRPTHTSSCSLASGLSQRP